MQNYCDRCGGKLLPGAGFCTSCGASVPPQTMRVRPQAGIICPLCGTENIGIMKFCRSCHAPFNEAVQNGGLSGVPLPNGAIAADCCTKCGASMKASAKFCEKCGAAFTVSPPPTAEPKQFCTGCGKPLEPREKFCTKCGAKTLMQPNAASNRFCTSCGAPLGPEERFCTKCGVKTLMRAATAAASTVGQFFTRETDAAPTSGEQFFDLPGGGLQ